MPNPQAGTILGAYRVEGTIGAGSMGEVFRGIDTGLNRRVAIKILSEKHRDSPELRARFVREGRAVAAISHPNVVQVFATGQGRKTDATDAHSIALVGTRMSGLRPVVHDEQLAVLRVLVDRRRSLGDEHTSKTSQLHALLLELIPGGAKKDLSPAQARKLLASVRPRDVVGKTRRRVAAELACERW